MYKRIRDMYRYLKKGILSSNKASKCQQIVFLSKNYFLLIRNTQYFNTVKKINNIPTFFSEITSTVMEIPVKLNFPVNNQKQQSLVQQN